MKKSKAIALFGSSSNLAKALGVWPSAVSQWGNEVPPLRAFQINELIESGHPLLVTSDNENTSTAAEG